MKKALLSALSILLVAVMMIGTLVSCSPKGNDETTGTTSENVTESTESTTDSQNQVGDTSDTTGVTNDTDDTDDTDEESSTEEDSSSVSLSGEHGPLIEHAYSLAHGVQAFFPDASRKVFNIQNSEMTLAYARSAEDKQLVSYIKNTKGKSYIENTMDVFIRMKNGTTLYASDSIYDAQVNLFRFGYYYFDADFQGQSFIPKDLYDNATNKTAINLKEAYAKSTSRNVKTGLEKDGFKISISNTNDPYAIFQEFEYSTDDYNVLSLTLKTKDSSRFRVYVDIGEGFQHDHMIEFVIEPNGEFQRFTLPLFSLDGEGVYDGEITRIRIDPEGEVNSSVVVGEITLANADVSSIPTGVLINRKFHVYSDKMHQELQINTSVETANVAAIGTYTEIDKSTVDKILIIDKNEKTYSSLDGIKWAEVAAIAFDIKEAGIFGFIMPYDGKGGSVSVTEKDGKYVIVQEAVPENNTLVVSPKGSKNGNDLYTGYRIYTDENHDFDEFILENWYEQNPLNGKNIKVSTVSSDSGEFGGYNSLRGIYSLKVGSPVGHFWTPYNDPNKNYNVNFTISAGETSRDIYIMSDATNGLLECAALLDEDMMMLPMPIEVIKNFNDMHDFYNIDDYTFSEAIIPLTLQADQKYTYNLVNLYQNWGKFPLKQISQIPFHVAYYHLSTGVSETNCITPWFQYTYAGKPQSVLYTLPDHRPMSSPMWDTEPQHTYGGVHHWLEYTDSEGNFVSVENTSNIIDSFGPTYAEVEMNNISDDGKMKVTYTHIEMPQTDENRTYYIMEYEVLEDVTINNVKDNFQFYSVRSNDSTGIYQNVSYLDKDNKSAYADANKSVSAAPEYVLGDKSPYFTFYNMPGKYDSKANPEGYSFDKGYTNMAFIIHSTSFTVCGEDYDPEFLLINTQNQLKLTLNADTLTLKAGDKITINAILLPWGSQDSVYDRSNGKAPDQNVIDVRENSCLDPITVKSETDEVLDSTYLPKIMSKDGKSGEFTLSGGKNANGRNAKGNYNVTVRVYGFDLLTAPKIEEYVDGEWVEYVVSSKDTPIRGSYHYYDGYCVYYDGDGTYSYSFVVDMTEGKDRKFRISADKEFEGWPEETPIEAVDHLKLYFDSDEISTILGTQAKTQSGVDGNVSFVSIYQKRGVSEFFTTIFSADDSIEETGNYFVFKYRIPQTNTVSTPYFEFFTSTTTKSVAEGHNFRISPICDGEWHVVVVDVATLKGHTAFSPTDGKYIAQYIRADFFNDMSKKPEDYNEDNRVDFAYIGMDSSLEDICKLNEDLDFIRLYQNGATIEIDTATGEQYKPTYVHPDSGYTLAEDILFYAALDSAGGTKVSKHSTSLNDFPVSISGIEVSSSISITLSGWCIADGGISKYVWSVDGGKTWNVISGSDALGNAGDEIYSYAQSNVQNGFTNKDADIKNGAFQESKKLVIDLKTYEGKTVNVIFGAITAKNTAQIIPLYVFENVKCSIESMFDSTSSYTESPALFYSILEWANEVVPASKETSNSRGYLKCNTLIPPNENNDIVLKGWAAVDGGISKYVWTADNGKTWYDCGGTPADSYDAIVNSAKGKMEGTLTSPDDIKLKGCFQEVSQRLIIDLDLLDSPSDPLVIYVGAVNAKNESKITVLFCFSKIDN